MVAIKLEAMDVIRGSLVQTGYDAGFANALVEGVGDASTQ